MQSLQVFENILARLRIAGENGLAIYFIDCELKEKYPYENEALKIYDELGDTNRKL